MMIIVNESAVASACRASMPEDSRMFFTMKSRAPTPDGVSGSSPAMLPRVIASIVIPASFQDASTPCATKNPATPSTALTRIMLAAMQMMISFRFPR